MKLLVTGGCGFLGSNLAAEGLLRGWQVTVFDNLSRMGSRDNLEWLNEQGTFEFVHGDTRNSYDVEGVVKDVCPDAVFHLAGQVAMTTSLVNPRVDFETNACGTFNLLEAIRKHAPQVPVFYSSTNKVYGDLERYEYSEEEKRYLVPAFPKGFDESLPLDFQSPYGCSKGAADQYMLDYARMFDLKTVVFRHSSMYGGRQFASFDQGWIGWFCQQSLVQKHDPQAEPFTIAGNGKQVRDVLHAADMRRLYFMALENVDRVKGQAFNVGGGMQNSLSLLELFDLLGDITGNRLRYRETPWRISDQRVFVADIQRISHAIGWVPQMSSRDGVADMVGWLESLPNS